MGVKDASTFATNAGPYRPWFNFQYSVLTPADFDPVFGGSNPNTISITLQNSQPGQAYLALDGVMQQILSMTATFGTKGGGVIGTLPVICSNATDTFVTPLVGAFIVWPFAGTSTSTFPFSMGPQIQFNYPTIETFTGVISNAQSYPIGFPFDYVSISAQIIVNPSNPNVYQALAGALFTI